VKCPNITRSFLIISLHKDFLLSFVLLFVTFYYYLLNKGFLFLAAYEIIGITCTVKNVCNITDTFQTDVPKLFINRNLNGGYNEYS